MPYRPSAHGLQDQPGTPPAPTHPVLDFIDAKRHLDIHRQPSFAPAPVGTIWMWFGNPANIPAGWAICNGSNGTPDLRGRVPVGVDAGQTEFDVLGETGGAKTHTLVTGEIPAHAHTQASHSHGITVDGNNFNTGTISADHSHSGTTANTEPPNHAHVFTSGGISANHTHFGKVGTNTGNHLHDSVDRQFAGRPNGANFFTGGNGTDNVSNDHVHGGTTAGVNASLSHAHSFGTGGVSANHTHNANHGHTASSNSQTPTINNTGGGAAHNNLQPYLALHFIMRITP